MKKSIVISENDNIAALLENDRVVEFFVNRGELLLGDIYTASVENILPGIDAAFVNLGKDKMGFLHANDVPGQGSLKEKLVPKQKLLVQITKEPTGHKGPRVSTAISLPGRFLVLVPEERGVSISRRISDAKERAKLKALVNLIKPPGVGLIIRTEAKGQGELELFEDFELLWDRWQTIVSEGEASIGPALIYRDQDLLYRVIRDAYSTDVTEIIVDSADGQRRAQEYMSGWAGRLTRVVEHLGPEPLLLEKNFDKEIEAALRDRVELPSGGHLNIQPTEALTVIDVNSGRFTSSRTQAETVRRTNLEAAQEIPRQLRLRNIGGMVIVDFIDMDSRRDQQQVLEVFQRTLEDDRAKPQIGQLSDLGLVELTRRRQGQSLRELFAIHCPTCSGLGVVSTLELGNGELRKSLSAKLSDEEIAARVRIANQGSTKRTQTGTLRAVTASNGRVKSLLVQEAQTKAGFNENFEGEFSSVPPEILEQVPEDLFLTNQKRNDAEWENFAGEDQGEVPEFETELEADNVPAELYHHSPKADTSEYSLPANELEHSIISHSNSRSEVVSLPESGVETEIDPVTGIYRLKTKSSSPEIIQDLNDDTTVMGNDVTEPMVEKSAISSGDQQLLSEPAQQEMFSKQSEEENTWPQDITYEHTPVQEHLAKHQLDEHTSYQNSSLSGASLAEVNLTEATRAPASFGEPEQFEITIQQATNEQE